MSSVTRGASPSEGSSSSRMPGSAISARPTASICCSPPDSDPALWRKRSLQARKQREHALAAAAELRLVAQQIGAELEILRDRHRREDAAPFRHQHQPARGADVGRRPRQRLAAEAHDAGIGDQAHDRAHERRLAGAVRSEDGDELAIRGRQAGGVKGLDAAVAGRKLLHLQDRMGRERVAHWTTLTCPLMMAAIRNGLTVMP